MQWLGHGFWGVTRYEQGWVRREEEGGDCIGREERGGGVWDGLEERKGGGGLGPKTLSTKNGPIRFSRL